MSHPVSRALFMSNHQDRSPIPDSSTQATSSETRDATALELLTPPFNTHEEAFNLAVRPGIKRAPSPPAGNMSATHLDSTAPMLKRLRRHEQPSSQSLGNAAAEPDGDIELIDQGAQQVEPTMAYPHDVTLADRVPDTDLATQIAHFCRSEETLQQNAECQQRPGVADSRHAQFARLLELASLTNQRDQVRTLLRTGLGNDNGALLRAIAQRANRAGALQAVDAITDTYAYWVQGIDPAVLGWPTVSFIQWGTCDSPPTNWQANVRQDLNRQQALALRDSFRAADANTARDLLFAAEHRPESGRFFMRLLSALDGDFVSLLASCGARLVNQTGSFLSIIVYANDFSHETLRNQLMHRQTTAIPHNEHPSALVLAAAWGDDDLFHALWHNASAEIRQQQASRALSYAVCSGASSIVRRLLPLSALHMPSPALSAMNACARESLVTSAAANGRIASLAILMEAGLIPPGHAEIASQALIAAAEAGQTATCAFLLRANALADNEPALAFSALMKAAEHGHLKTCQLLVTAGARLDMLEADGGSILSLAAELGQIEFYQYLVEHGADRQVPADHTSPLRCAAHADRAAMLDYLLPPDADINARDDDSYTLLMHACEAGASDTVALLLARGASVECRGAGLMSTIELAVKSGSLRTMKQLMRADAPAAFWMHGLLMAIRTNRLPMVRLLRDIAPMNPRLAGLGFIDNPLLAVNYQDTPTPAEETLAHHTILSILLSDPRVPRHHVNADADDALILAVEKRDAVAVAMLVNAGFQVGQHNTLGMNALDYAFERTEGNEHADPDAERSETDDRRQRSRIIRTLAKSVLQHPSRAHLTEEIWRTQEDPIDRDLAWFMQHAHDESTIDLTGMLEHEHRTISSLLVKFMSLSDEATATDMMAEFMQMGIPSAWHDRLASLLNALLPIRHQLVGDGKSCVRVFLTAIDGLYGHIAPEFDRLLEDASRHYAQTSIDEWWKPMLSAMAGHWLRGRIDVALRREQEEIGLIFAELFERCSATTRATASLETTPGAPPPKSGVLAAVLIEAGIYAALANEIDAAWTQAWQQVGLSPSRLLGQHTDAENEAALLAAFRGALKRRIDTPSGNRNLMTLPGASLAEEKLFGELMHRQLYMLTQFIHAASAQPS